MIRIVGAFGFFLISVVCISQVTFFGKTEPVSSLNSPYDEQYLFLDLDNEELFFTRSKHPGNLAGRSDNGDIWKASTDSLAGPVVLQLNDKYFAAPAGFTSGRKYFLFHRVWKDKGMTYGGVFAGRSPNAQESFALQIPHFKNRSPIQTGSISQNGKYLMLSMENNLGYGVDDLFVCILDEEGNWSAPKNLGRTLNTSLQEITPFLAADNKTLFFASNGHGGEGSFDVFVTTRQDETWQKWSAPLNIGSSVNTAGAESGFVFSPDSKYAYFISTQNSDGYGDVKRIRIEEEIQEVLDEQPSVALNLDSAGEEQMEIILRDKRTQEVLVGRALLIDGLDTTTYKSGKDGRIYITGMDRFTAEFKSDGYLSVKQTISTETTKAVYLEPLASGNTITLENVLFYRGTANFVEGSEEELDLVVEMLNENPDIRIFLKGHTDNVGNPQLNIQLSKERVLAVKDYLVRSGIEANRVQGEGYGGNVPIASNAKEETRKLNRRVEFEVLRN